MEEKTKHISGTKMKKIIKNDLYLQLLSTHEIVSDVIKMWNIKNNMDKLDIKNQNTKKFRKMIVGFNLILNAFNGKGF